MSEGLQAEVLMQVAVELSVPSVGLSPSLQTLQAAVDTSVRQVSCLPAPLLMRLQVMRSQLEPD